MATLDQATRRALALGASLELDGKVINASHQKLTVVLQKPAAPAPPAPPAPPPPDPMAIIKPLIEAQAIQAAAQNESISNILIALLAEINKPKTEGAPRALPIAFDLERDKNTNLLKRIVPVYRLGALN